jgi:hypothetical protein
MDLELWNLHLYVLDRHKLAACSYLVILMPIFWHYRWVILDAYADVDNVNNVVKLQGRIELQGF